MTSSPTRTQKQLLEVLRRDGSVSQSGAAERLDVTPPTIRRAVNALADAGHGVTKETRDGQRIYNRFNDGEHTFGTLTITGDPVSKDTVRR